MNEAPDKSAKQTSWLHYSFMIAMLMSIASLVIDQRPYDSAFAVGQAIPLAAIPLSSLIGLARS